jgi:AraC family transcriptional regulator, positive regulator of tynA and feaB
MPHNGDFTSQPQSTYEQWRDMLRALGGSYSAAGADPEPFSGWVTARRICGINAIDLSCNAPRLERTNRDVRQDGMDHYYALFQWSGQTVVSQGDQVAMLDVGDMALVDAARPVTYTSQTEPGEWLSLHLSRKSMVSHFGFELQGGSRKRGETLAGRLLLNLVADAANNRLSSPTESEPYMQLAIYDLLGAVFAGSELSPVASHTDKLFARIRCIIKGRFAEPDLAPLDVAKEAGISLRYLQKLLTARGTTCSLLIQSIRLEQASALLHRQATTKTRQPLHEIAFSCGFVDYNNFGRLFRRRFGYPPSAAETH